MLQLLNPIHKNLSIQKSQQGRQQEQHSTAGDTAVTVEICHFQVKNICLRDYKYGAEHTQ